MGKETILIKNEQEMEKFALQFSKKIKPGDVIELLGDLGSGKTFFVRALSQALGATGISSPSFVIKNEYMDGKFPIIHFDFYRLNDPGIVKEELKESLSAGNLVIIEWADSIREVLPDDCYKIKFKITDKNSRELEIKR